LKSVHSPRKKLRVAFYPGVDRHIAQFATSLFRSSHFLRGRLSRQGAALFMSDVHFPPTPCASEIGEWPTECYNSMLLHELTHIPHGRSPISRRPSAFASKSMSAQSREPIRSVVPVALMQVLSSDPRDPSTVATLRKVSIAET